MAVVIAVDLDNFADIVKERGWTSYSPNPVTRYLSHAVSAFCQKHAATIIHGLDIERGTEEAVIYCSDVDIDTITADLEMMRKEVYALYETTLSVGIAHVPSTIPVKLIKDLPLAKKALKESKRKGEIIIL